MIGAAVLLAVALAGEAGELCLPTSEEPAIAWDPPRTSFAAQQRLQGYYLYGRTDPADEWTLLNTLEKCDHHIRLRAWTDFPRGTEVWIGVSAVYRAPRGREQGSRWERESAVTELAEPVCWP